MTIAELANKIAEDFNNMIKEQEFDSFKEMADCYDWDSVDIKEEIYYAIKDFSNDKIWLDDDNELHNEEEPDDPNDLISYRKFRTMVFRNVK